MSDNKPAFKVDIKAEGGASKAVSLFAFWRKEDGKLRGSLDGKIVQLSVMLEDGSTHHVKLKPGTKYADHFINCYENEAHAAKFAGPKPSGSDDDIFSAGTSKPRTGTNDAAGDSDAPEEDLPF